MDQILHTSTAEFSTKKQTKRCRCFVNGETSNLDIKVIPEIHRNTYFDWNTTHTIYAFMIGGCVSRQGSKTRPFGFLGDTLFQTHLPTCPKSTGVKSTKKNYKHQTWKEYLPVLKVSLFFFGILTEKNPLWVKLKRFLDPSFVAKENTTRNRWEIQRCHTRQTWDGCCWMFLDINHATSPA